MITEEQLIDILGDDLYNDCISFFADVFSKKSMYKIILTRRCFSLYKLFAPILEEKYNRRNEYGQIITDHAVEYYLHKIQEAISTAQDNYKPILIVDDIIIYGRTINNILDKILFNLHESYVSKISVSCISWNRSETKIKDCYKGIINANKISSKIEWKLYSKNFSTAIKATDIANTSYVVSLKKSDTDFTWLFDCLKKESIDISTPELQQYNVESFVLNADIIDTHNTQGLFKYNICSFIRFYHYVEYNTILILPLVVMDNVDTSKLGHVINLLSPYFDNNSHLHRILNDTNANICAFKVRLISLLLSHILLCDFTKTYAIDSEISEFDYEEILSMNFSEEIVDDFIKFHDKVYNDNNKLFCYNIQDLQKPMVELENFVFLNAMQDNFSAQNNILHRKDGISDFKNTNIFSKYYIPTVARMIDNGIAALKVNCSSDFICQSLLYPGEQAFRIMNDQYVDVLPAMFAIENMAYIFEWNEYDLYKQFATRISKKLFNHDDLNRFLEYIGILEKTKQKISNIMCVEVDAESQLYQTINEELTTFIKEVQLSNDISSNS